MTVRTSVEGPRGCGYRQPGGVYLVSDGLMDFCDRLPIPLAVCPTCGHGTKPSRGWTWVRPDDLLEGFLGPHGEPRHSTTCPLGAPGRLADDTGRCGLLWIGEKFYPTPADFTREGVRMGVSRRVAAIPRGFVLGDTWILVAHRKAVLTWPDGAVGPRGDDPTFTPGIFHAFRPTRIEYIVKDDDSDDRLAELEARGFTLVRVVRAEEEQGVLA